MWIYDAAGKPVVVSKDIYRNLTDEWTPYILNVAALEGPVTVILHGGYIDNSGSPDSQYAFSRISLF